MKLRAVSSLVAVALVILFNLLAPSGAFAGDDLSVSQIHTASSTDLIQVGNSWRRDLPERISASLHATADTPASSVFVKAYFYDRDNNLIETLAKPSKIWTQTERGFEEVALPPVLKAGQHSTIYFAIDEKAKAQHWKSIVIVFGNGSEVVAHSYPADAIDQVSFPEKSKLTAPSDGNL